MRIILASERKRRSLRVRKKNFSGETLKASIGREKALFFIICKTKNQKTKNTHFPRFVMKLDDNCKCNCGPELIVFGRILRNSAAFHEVHAYLLSAKHFLYN